MIEVYPTDQQKSRASFAYEEEKRSPRNSIRFGEGIRDGCLGEIVVADYYGWDISKTYDYDLVSPKGIRIDVKTKVRTVAPESNFNCSVAAANIKQQCDCYLFVSLLKDWSRCWILGYVTKQFFFENAVFRKKDESDPEKNGWSFAADCYNIHVDQLKLPNIERIKNEK